MIVVWILIIILTAKILFDLSMPEENRCYYCNDIPIGNHRAGCPIGKEKHEQT
jgi:hypothetical protein